jgi:hypothetical protein
VRVTYQALPWGTPSPVFVAFQEKGSDLARKIEAFQVKSFDDVKPLVGSIEITPDAIILKPRTSATAKMTTRDYKTPVRVPMSRILG